MTTTAKIILVAGGAGYIGSHTIVCLLEQGYNVVVVDNLVNSSMTSLDRVAELANLDEADRKERLVFHEADLCDRDALKRIFETSPTFYACIHFAGLKVNKYKSIVLYCTIQQHLSAIFCHIISYQPLSVIALNIGRGRINENPPEVLP